MIMDLNGGACAFPSHPFREVVYPRCTVLRAAWPMLYCVACRMAYVVLRCMPHVCCTVLHAAWRMLYCVACRMYVVLRCMPHLCCAGLHAAWRMLYGVACRMAHVVLCCMPHLCCTGLHAAWRMLCCVAQGGDLSDHFDKKRPLTPEMSRCGPRTGKATVGLTACQRSPAAHQCGRRKLCGC